MRPEKLGVLQMTHRALARRERKPDGLRVQYRDVIRLAESVHHHPPVALETRLDASRAFRIRVGNAGQEAACGGQWVCATCHVPVDPARMDVVGAPTDIEVDLLGSSIERQTNSRLRCRITLSAQLHGLAVTVAPAEG